MLRSFFLTKEWALWAWGGLLILFALVVFQVEMTVKLNEWYKNILFIQKMTKTTPICL